MFDYRLGDRSELVKNVTNELAAMTYGAAPTDCHRQGRSTQFPLLGMTV